jgi:hypothetical protein
LCYILAKNFSTFCLWLKILEEAEFKGGRLINLVEEISRQSSVCYYCWLHVDRCTVRVDKAKQKELKNLLFV